VSSAVASETGVFYCTLDPPDGACLLVPHGISYKTGANGVSPSLVIFHRLLLLLLLMMMMRVARYKLLVMAASDRGEAVILAVGGCDARHGAEAGGDGRRDGHRRRRWWRWRVNAATG